MARHHKNIAFSVTKEVLLLSAKLNQHSHCSLFALCIDIHISVGIYLYVYVHYWTAFYRSLLSTTPKLKKQSRRKLPNAHQKQNVAGHSGLLFYIKICESNRGIHLAACSGRKEGLSRTHQRCYGCKRW